MAGSRDDLPVSHPGLPGLSIADSLEMARVAERHDLARRLHDGILQDLTVAGFRLKSLHDQVPPGARASVHDLSTWLQGRQAELRELVASLESVEGQTSPGGDRRAVALLGERLGCQVSYSQVPDDRDVAADLRPVLMRVVEGAMQIVASRLGARNLNVTLRVRGRKEPKLGIAHDGKALRDEAHELGLLRRLVGSNGASLRISTRAGREHLIIDWTA